MFDITGLYEAQSIDHALSLLQKHSDGVLIAGGSDVLIKLRSGALTPCPLISIHKLDELRTVSLNDDGALRIGALMTFSLVSAHPLIRQHVLVLSEAAATVGGPQVRNIGTLGGNVCNGVTSADTASTLIAFDAVFEYTGRDGVRLVPSKDHYLAAGKTALRHDEILTAIIIPKESYEQTFGHYIKYSMRNAMDIATLGCSVNVRLSRNGALIERLRIAYGVAGPVPERAGGAEKAVEGMPADAAIETAASTAVKDLHPRDSWRASGEFRLHLAGELVRRAMRMAIDRARESLIK
jgi:xanthine dehydrogenase FAD-binding subunit